MDISNDIQALVEARLDARSLLSLIQTCHAFNDGADQLARTWLLAKHGPQATKRWRHLTWQDRLRLETCVAGFERVMCSDFTFSSDDGTGIVAMNGLGPKLLVSDATTRDNPTLTWRFFVRGNAAIEVGVVPDDMPYDHMALNKCPKAPVDGIPAGVYSDACGGSCLHFVAPIVKNSYVEVVASRDALHILVEKPADAADAAKGALKGPSGFAVPTAFRMTINYSNNNNRNVRLALTAWAKAKFEFV